MSKTTAGLLEHAWRLIDKPEKWTKGCAARDRADRAVSYRSDRARRFCAYGAIDRVTYCDLTYYDFSLNIAAMSALQNVLLENADITDWNDDPRRTHDEVRDAFERAIAIAKGEIQ